MSLFQLWWTAVVHPSRAFEEVGKKPAPLWAFWVLLTFNILISLTTNLFRYLSGGEVLLPSWLSFLPDDRYLLAELFFLPLLRLSLWLLGAAVIHLGVRLMGQPSSFDLILQMGGVVYLVVMPYTFAVDWITLALGAYGLGLIAIIHGAVDLLWSLLLSFIGLRVLLGLKALPALALLLASQAFTFPLQILFAR